MSSDEGEETLDSSYEADDSGEETHLNTSGSSQSSAEDDVLNVTSQVSKMDISADGNEGDNEDEEDDKGEEEFDDDDLELLGEQPVTNVSVRPLLKPPRKSGIVFLSSGEESDVEDFINKNKPLSKKSDPPLVSPQRQRLDSVELQEDDYSISPILPAKKKVQVMTIDDDDSDEVMSISPQKPLLKKDKIMIIEDNDSDEVMFISPQKPIPVVPKMPTNARLNLDATVSLIFFVVFVCIFL